MTPFLIDLKGKLDTFRQNGQPILDGVPVFETEKYGELVSINKDCEMYKKLFEITNDNEFDELTIQAFEFICHALLVILERQAKDQLDGGKYRAPSQTVNESAKNVPSHNKASESDFAILDLLIRTKPNSNIETLQCITMWSRNKTDSWLNSKSPEEQKNIFVNAQKYSGKMKEKFKQRQHQLLVRKK